MVSYDRLAVNFQTPISYEIDKLTRFGFVWGLIDSENYLVVVVRCASALTLYISEIWTSVSAWTSWCLTMLPVLG